MNMQIYMAGKVLKELERKVSWVESKLSLDYYYQTN